MAQRKSLLNKIYYWPNNLKGIEPVFFSMNWNLWGAVHNKMKNYKKRKNAKKFASEKSWLIINSQLNRIAICNTSKVLTNYILLRDKAKKKLFFFDFGFHKKNLRKLTILKSSKDCDFTINFSICNVSQSPQLTLAWMLSIVIPILRVVWPYNFRFWMDWIGLKH